MKHNYVVRSLSSIFYRIGYHIGYCPHIYVVMALITLITLGFGIHKISMTRDIEYLFTPDNSRSIVERKWVENMFPGKIPTAYEMSKRTRYGKFGSIIIESKNKSSMLDDAAMKDVLTLDGIVRNITFYMNDKFVGYSDLFPKESDTFTRNMILYFKKNAKKIKQGKVTIRYPTNRRDNSFTVYAINIGGVHTKDERIDDFKSFRLYYTMKCKTKEQNDLASAWEEHFAHVLSKVHLKNINFYTLTSHSLGDDITSPPYSVLVLCIFTLLTSLYVILSSLSSDVITSKPLMGLAGYLSPIFATTTAFGLLVWLQKGFVRLNFSIFFLILGIGINDYFVLLAKWRRTDRNDHVRKRVADTFSEVGIPITLTSLVNILLFSIGFTSSYGMVKIFSLYSVVSIVFNYVYQIFFFGGCMALDGYREKHNLHCILLTPVTTKLSGDKRFEESKEYHKGTSVIKNFIGRLFGNWCVKFFSVLIFLFYISCAVYFVAKTKENFNFLNVFSRSSNTYKYFSAQRKYFSEYPYTIQLVLNQTLDYSNSNTRRNIKDIVSNLQSSPLIFNFSMCWFNEYHKFSTNNRTGFLFEKYNLTDPKGYLAGLKDVFLKFKPFLSFNNDILFNEKGDEIVASRCFLVSQNIKSYADEKLLLESVRTIADNSKYSVFAYNMYFPIYERNLYVSTYATTSISIAAVVIAVVFSVFIQDVTCVLLVMLTVICIQVATVGFVTLWGVSINIVSVIIVFIGISFSVEFLAHVIYYYKSLLEKDADEKIKTTLHHVGYAVAQGFLSIVLKVSIFYFNPSYMYPTCFKILLVMMIFALYHTLVLIPVAFSMAQCFTLPWKKLLRISDERPI
ncbi:patched domain-containing protein 3-like [Centruroides sculpturatus]|uniref:patched domain-containing protein 3-like n=1 Tax=Centruroides sculpturatus TaxID=218467 RepID=UPI000C6DA274|nr:patched domain-containing protein 3-like [Centruroides sculpturatus]XP_023229397.1 patched domain-containing protein 3-like [Centruroides sculpturatus]